MSSNKNTKESFDFLSIGDAVVDDFIRLKDAEVHCDVDTERCTICMRFGDKVPFESSTVIYGVGNSANAAVSAVRLGLQTSYITNIGKDERGDEIVRTYIKEKIDTSLITQHEGAPTNYHYVLWYGDQRTILVNHYAYPYQFPQTVPEPKIVYLTSLAGGTEQYHDDVATYLEAHPNIFLTFQPGTFQIKIGAERLARLYKRAQLFVVNKEEAQRILATPQENNDETLARNLYALGPKTVVITDDTNGASALENDVFFHLPMYRDPKPPVEKTGAGDAFTSTTAVYYGTGTPLKEAMERGMINAAYVVQEIGAQRGLLAKETLEAKYKAFKGA